MTVVELTKNNPIHDLERGGIKLVYFWAESSSLSRSFKPVYKKVAEKHGDVVFGTVDAQAERELTTAFGISSVPTLLITREGVTLVQHAGVLSESALEDLIAQARALKMDEVRVAMTERAAEDESAAEDSAEDSGV